MAGECHAFGKTCQRCGKKNHFERVCKSRKNPGKRINQIEDSDDEDDSDDEYVRKVTVESTKTAAEEKTSG